MQFRDSALGYLVASPDIVSTLKVMLPHWNINALALVIGAGCLDEKDYCNNAIQHAATQRQWLHEFLDSAWLSSNEQCHELRVLFVTEVL